MKFIKQFIKKYNFLYVLLKPCVIFLRKCLDFILRNRSLLTINEPSNNYKNIFVFDTRVSSILFDSVMLLIRASNFFYNDKWNIIIYEDSLYRYGDKHVPKEIYLNNLINLFLQGLLILPNPPITIKFVSNNYALLKIIRKSKKKFPENYNYLNESNAYLVNDFNEKDFQNFKINQPILKATKNHSEIFANYLDYRDIKKYITMTIRTKNWSNNHWNTNLDDIKLYLDFIRKNNLSNHDLILIPDTEKDIPKEMVDLIKNSNLKFHIFHHGAFSIPLRFLAYSQSSFNLSSTNGPVTILYFIKNNSFLLVKDPHSAEKVENFVNKFNKFIFLNRKFILYKKYAFVKKTII